MKIILVKTQYKINNSKLMTNVETFKTWQDYLEGCKYKVLILTNHNNPRSITAKVKLKKQPIFCHTSSREAKTKKKPFKLRIS